MNKLSRMLIDAQKRLPSQEVLQMRAVLSGSTADVILDMINDVKSDEHFHAIVYELVDRAAKGGLWHGKN